MPGIQQTLYMFVKMTKKTNQIKKTKHLKFKVCMWGRRRRMRDGGSRFWEKAGERRVKGDPKSRTAGMGQHESKWLSITH